jgi:hypothetical protein
MWQKLKMFIFVKLCAQIWFNIGVYTDCQKLRKVMVWLLVTDTHKGNNWTHFCYGSSGFAGIDTMVTFKALL